MKVEGAGLRVAAGLYSHAFEKTNGVHRMVKMVFAFAIVVWTTVSAAVVQANALEVGIGQKELTFVDQTRSVKAAMGFVGTPTRRIDVKVWYPTELPAAASPMPLVVYTHGTFGYADNAMYLVNALVKSGYVVAAPDYPLTSRKSYTRVRFADISDVAEQLKDLSFVISQLLSDPVLGKMIDHEAIGSTGHSMGATMSYFITQGQGIRDPRIKAAAPIAGGDPVTSALGYDMGFFGTKYAEVSVPMLFVTGDRDMFTRSTGNPLIAYTRVQPPKYELLIKGATHVWFRDRYQNENEELADNVNPDCVWLEKNAPAGEVFPGCKERTPLINSERQRKLTRDAIVAFFDAYLKGDERGLEQLRALGQSGEDVAMAYME